MERIKANNSPKGATKYLINRFLICLMYDKENNKTIDGNRATAT